MRNRSVSVIAVMVAALLLLVPVPPVTPSEAAASNTSLHVVPDRMEGLPTVLPSLELAPDSAAAGEEVEATGTCPPPRDDVGSALDPVRIFFDDRLLAT